MPPIKVKDMVSQPRTITPAKLYGDAGLLHIRYHAIIETKPNGQKKVGGPRPAFSKIAKDRMPTRRRKVL